jgi:hypothetical protein
LRFISLTYNYGDELFHTHLPQRPKLVRNKRIAVKENGKKQYLFSEYDSQKKPSYPD